MCELFYSLNFTLRKEKVRLCLNNLILINAKLCVVISCSSDWITILPAEFQNFTNDITDIRNTELFILIVVSMPVGVNTPVSVALPAPVDLPKTVGLMTPVAVSQGDLSRPVLVGKYCYIVHTSKNYTSYFVEKKIKTIKKLLYKCFTLLFAVSALRP